MNKLTLKSYIEKYFNKDSFPGEHHFVAVYLLPQFDNIPDYVNPNGTKGFCGDIGFKTEKSTFSIEVKIGKKSFKFSKNENNDWILNENNNLSPNYLIALTYKYLFILRWEDFLISYKKVHPYLSQITDAHKNSPCISDEDLIEQLSDKSGIFPLKDLKDETKINERFKELNNEIEKLVI